MGTSDENLNGIGMTAKDLLLEVRLDVKTMSKNVDILVSQNLDTRLKTVESWKDQLTGKIVVASALVSVAVAAATHIVTNIILTGQPK